MSGLAETLAANENVQGAGKSILEAWDAGLNALAGIAGLSEGLGILDGILALLNPTSQPSGPTLQDLQHQIDDFAQTVYAKLNALGATIAAGQVKQHATDIQQVLWGSDGPVSIIGEIPTWTKTPGLPLPDAYNPQQYQIFARAALLQLLGGGPGGPWPTPMWYLPVGDLPLFQPDNPWTYNGTKLLFNRSYWVPLGSGSIDLNPYTQYFGSMPQFDLSMLTFTNDFSPTAVNGVPPGNAFNPTWILPQSIAAVNYYLIICGVVLRNFPNDGSTIRDLFGSSPASPIDNNFVGGLSRYHDQIRAGIVCLAPPFPFDLMPLDPTDPEGLIAASADEGVSPWSIPCFDPNPGTNKLYYFDDGAEASDAAAGAPTSQWSRPFGALCSYTGFVAGFGGPQPSVDGYPNYVYPTPGQTEFPPLDPNRPHPEDAPTYPQFASKNWHTGFYCKYFVACLWRVKLVYLGMGLSDMWDSINNLYIAFGQPPRRGPSPGDWSMKEVFRTLGSADYPSFPLPEQEAGPTGLTKFTVRAFLQFMNNAAPTPPAKVTSLRAMLQA